MTILQAGTPKSGNFWLYKILQQIMQEAGLPRRSFIQRQPIFELARQWDLSYPEQAGIDMLDIGPQHYFCRISSVYRMPIESLEDYVARASHLWTHSDFSPLCYPLFSLVDKIIYIIRDPRDRALSEVRFAFTPYMQKYYPHGQPDVETYLQNYFDQIMHHWVWHVGNYLLQRSEVPIHFVFYERLLHDFPTELQRLLDYLQLSLTPAARQKIADDVHFSSLKKGHANHVRKGKSNRWKQQFNEAQQERTRKLAGPLMSLLSYSLHASKEMLPSLPEQQYSHKINLMLKEMQ
ncbi:MAG: sulfotransferase domain-containing protein [Cyclobacteriaceae bacterium]